MTFLGKEYEEIKIEKIRKEPKKVLFLLSHAG